MCSINEAEDGLMISDVKPGKDSLKICMKCQDKATILVRARDPMCRSCFIQYFTHKFRATLGKSKAIRQGEKVLIAFSGGQASCCLLHLVRELSKKKRGILPLNEYVKPKEITLKEGQALEWSEEKINAVAKDIQLFSKQLGFNVDVVPLEQLFMGESDTINDSCSCAYEGENNLSRLSSNETAMEQLKKSFKSSKSLTAKQDLLSAMRSQLLRLYAKEKNCTKIIVAETSSRLSIKLLLNITQGRGGSLPFEVGVNDSRDDQVAIIRPMRELAANEVAFYNRMHDIEPIVTESLDTLEANNASLQKQTEAFVMNLQTSFPSTVSTIFRTGDKLTISEDLKSTEDRCIMCQAPTAEIKATVSVDTIEEERPQDSQQCCGEGDGSCQKSRPTTLVIKKEDIIGKLCYGCRLTFKDMGNDVQHLPPFVIEGFERSFRRSKMKDSIQDFLLE